MAIDFPSNPTNGQVYGNYIYDSSITAWRNVNTDTGIGTLNAMGLKNVVPTSVNVGSGSATVNANGLVTFTGATSISLNNIFSSTYANYRMNINISSVAGSGGGWGFRYRSAGVDRSTTNYFTAGNYSYYGADGGYSASSITGTDLGYLYASSDPYAVAIADIFDPAKTLMTRAITNIGTLNSGGGWTSYRINDLHNLNQAHDGLTLFGSSNPQMSGTIQVYGYTN